MQDGSNPTQMFAEAAQAAEVVRVQRDLNTPSLARFARELRRDPPSSVLTVARGSSDHAATYARYLIETRLQLMTASQSPSIASIYAGQPRVSGALAIAISQSGQSPDLLATVQALKSGGARIMALVNDEMSSLAHAAPYLVPLHAGPERSVAATKSYIATLAAIADFVAHWSADSRLSAALDELPDRLARAWAEDWTPLVDGLQACRGLYVIGRGLGLGIAQEAALKFKETCGLHAEAFSAAEVRHGPLALVGPDFPLLVFNQSDEAQRGNDALVADVLERGGTVFVAGPTTTRAIPLPSAIADSVIEPLLQVQSFYRAVNAVSIRRGKDPDRPRNLAKLTETL